MESEKENSFSCLDVLITRDRIQLGGRTQISREPFFHHPNIRAGCNFPKSTKGHSFVKFEKHLLVLLEQLL